MTDTKKSLPVVDDPGAPFRAVVETVSEALNALPEGTAPDVVVAGLVLAACSITVAAGGREEDFVEGCRGMFKVALAGKDRAEG